MSPVSFFQPAYAWGLIVLAVPVIIHLINRRRSRRLDFSTLRFFQASAVRAHRTRRLKRLLLLCCRLLLLSTVVLIFSQPFDKQDPFALLLDPNAALFCWVDPTKSMEYVDKGAPLWRRAMALIDSLDKKAPYSARRYRYDPARDKFILTSALHFEKSVYTRHGRPLCANMLTAFRNESRGSSRPAVLVLFSDFQENTSQELDSFHVADTAHARVLYVRLGPDKPINAGIRHVAASRERPFFVSGDIAARGMDGRSAWVSVFFGDMRIGHESVLIQSGLPTAFSLEIAGEKCPGGVVRLEADDPFPLDNVRYFTLGEFARQRVVVVGDTAENFPLAAAFRSMGPSQWNPVVQRLPQDLSVSDIDSADLIICNAMTYISRPLQLLRTTKLFGPKALMVAAAVDSQFSPSIAPLFGGPASGMGPKIVRVEKPCGLIFYDTISMIGKGFRRLEDNDAAIFRYSAPLPGKALCFLDNRTPFATHRIDSLGHSWTFFAAPIGRALSNNLCETGIYVPLLDRIARYSLESVRRRSDEWIAGRPRRNPFLGARHPAYVYTVQNERQAQWGGQARVTFDEPGIYRIQPDEGVSYWVAVNADSEETDLSYRIPKSSVFANAPVTVVGGEEFLSGLKAGKGGLFSYGPWIALAMLLLVEMLLWEREGGRKKEPKQRKA